MATKLDPANPGSQPEAVNLIAARLRRLERMMIEIRDGADLAAVQTAIGDQDTTDLAAGGAAGVAAAQAAEEHEPA